MTSTPHRTVEALREIVGSDGVVAPEDAAPYQQGARYGHGRALLVVRPTSAAAVQNVVRECARRGVRIVPQGANSGLVGASTPDASGRQIVLSLERLCAIHDVSVTDRTVTVDAGVRLSALNAALARHGLWFPIDLGADPQIGGMVATNTGGSRLIRYGDVRRNLMALEAVMLDPPGEMLSLGRHLRKDNTGYDFKHLFVGTSGASGIITKATLEVQPLPRQRATALVVPRSDQAVLDLLVAAEAQLGDFLSAFEGMSSNAMAAAIGHVPNLRTPFASGLPTFALLVELESSISPSSGIDLQDALNRFLGEQFEGLIDDAVIGRREDLWRLRHSISDGLRHRGRVLAFDISVPRSRIMAFRQEARATVKTICAEAEVFDFGHIADGGLHFNIVLPQLADPVPQAVSLLRTAVYRLAVQSFGGSFSAEHGIGPHNIDFYQAHVPLGVQAMAGRVQSLMDPHGLCRNVWFGLAQDRGLESNAL